MKTALALLALFPLLLPGFAQAGAVHDACRRLCENETDCVRRCVSHAELFELNSEFVNACANFHPSVEMRMKVLRSGATIEVLPLCKDTGWSIDHVVICLRSYPTPEVIKACKKVSNDEEAQVRCLRSGRAASQIEACQQFSSSESERERCLNMNLDALVVRGCRVRNESMPERFNCLRAALKEKQRETDDFVAETRRRVAAEEAEQKRLRGDRRMPASAPPSPK